MYYSQVYEPKNTALNIYETNTDMVYGEKILNYNHCGRFLTLAYGKLDRKKKL